MKNETRILISSYSISGLYSTNRIRCYKQYVGCKFVKILLTCHHHCSLKKLYIITLLGIDILSECITFP